MSSLLPLNKIHVQSSKQDNGEVLMETSEVLHKEPINCDTTLNNIIPRMKNEKDATILYQGVNQIFTYVKNGELAFYIPAYVRITINRVSRIDYLGGRATIDASFRFWVMVEGLPSEIHQQILDECEISINKEWNFRLKDII